MLGDVNENLSKNDKYGGQLRSENQMAKFRHVMEDCNLGVLGFRGNIFAWNKGREGDSLVCECLDRCFAFPKWRELFPFQSVTHGIVAYSDHTLVWLEMKEGFEIMGKGCQTFPF